MSAMFRHTFKAQLTRAVYTLSLIAALLHIVGCGDRQSQPAPPAETLRQSQPARQTEQPKLNAPPKLGPPATAPDPLGAELRSHIAAMNALLKDSNELVDETNEVLRLKAEGLDCDRVNLTLQMSSSLMDSYSEKAKPEAEWFDHIPKDPEIVTRLRKDKQLRGELDQLKAKRKAFYRKSMALAPRMRLCAPASEVKIWTMTIWVD